jgi:hypothetical protein
VYPGGGPSCIVKGLPLRGVAFRITGFPAFWISGDHGALVSGRTGPRPRETLEPAHYRSTLAAVFNFGLSGFQDSTLSFFPAFPVLLLLGERCSLVASMPDLSRTAQAQLSAERLGRKHDFLLSWLPCIGESGFLTRRGTNTWP